MRNYLPLIAVFFMFLLLPSSVSAQSATSSATASATTTSSSSASTTTTTSSKGGVELPEELPETGSTETTMALILLGICCLGIGMYVHRVLPLVLEDEA